jgi:twitching motility protein PilT
MSAILPFLQARMPTPAETSWSQSHLHEDFTIRSLHRFRAVCNLPLRAPLVAAEQQNNIMYQLSNSLQAILAQTLLPRTGGSLVLASEVCVTTSAIRKHIRDGSPHQIISEIQAGKKHGMRAMDDCLLSLYQKGEITFDTALSHARDPNSMRTRTSRDTPNGTS